MTTIAYNHKDKQVAIDSRYTRGDLIDTDKGDKIRKNKKGIYLLAGHQGDFEDLMSLNKNDKVEIRPECGGVLISNGKAYSVDTDNEGFFIMAELTENLTVGSGSSFALAAMDFGMSAKDAVNYAKTRDIYTGGRVRVIDVK